MSSRAHMAGLPEDLESAEFIEKRWIDDGLTVFKTKYDVLLSYPSNVTRNLYDSIFFSDVQLKQYF